MTSQKIHKKISTHPLTVLIISAIVQLEQREREKISFRSSKMKKVTILTDINIIRRNKLC